MLISIRSLWIYIHFHTKQVTMGKILVKDGDRLIGFFLHNIYFPPPICQLCLTLAKKISNISLSDWLHENIEIQGNDFYITDRNSGVRAVVKAGSGSKVIPLVIESKLVNAKRKCRILSPHLRKLLRDRKSLCRRSPFTTS